MKQLMIAVAGLHILLSSVPALAQFPSPRVCRANLEARNAQGLSWNADPFWHSPADAAYFNVLGGAAGCSENFGYVQYFNWAFRTPQSSWEAAGYTDSCNPNQPYTKAWMAAHLVHKGVNYGGEAPPNYPYPYIRRGAALLRQLGMERSRSLDPPEAGLGDRKRVGDLTICIA